MRSADCYNMSFVNQIVERNLLMSGYFVAEIPPSTSLEATAEIHEHIPRTRSRHVALHTALVDALSRAPRFPAHPHQQMPRHRVETLRERHCVTGAQTVSATQASQATGWFLIGHMGKSQGDTDILV